jgi:hypothetical protein
MVAIYEFRSGVSEIGARAATDMFITALMQTGRFRVMERARLNEGVVREKQLNASGASTGEIGGQQLHGVRYLFEGTLSEANASQDQRASGVNLGGMEIGGGRNRDAVAIDVRVVDASTGEIMDVVTVRRTVDATQSGISGVGNPDLRGGRDARSSHCDRARRACAEFASRQRRRGGAVGYRRGRREARRPVRAMNARTMHARPRRPALSWAIATVPSSATFLQPAAEQLMPIAVDIETGRTAGSSSSSGRRRRFWI